MIIEALIIGAILGIIIHSLNVIPTLLVILVYLALIGLSVFGVVQLITHPMLVKSHGTAILIGAITMIVISFFLPKK